jgi:hypothetical protein
MDETAKDAERLAGSLDKVDKEGKKAAKSVDDVAGNGGAIAILDSLTGGLATRLKDAFEASKLFNGSLKATRGALLATGIGAFVVSLGLVVTYWDDIVEFITRANERLEEQLQLNRSNADVLSSEIGLLDKKISLLTKEGKATEALQEQKKALVKQAQEYNKEQIKILEVQLERLKATSEELSLWEKIKGAAAFAFLGAEGAAQYSTDTVRERAKAINELEQALLKAKGEAIDLETVLFDIDNPEQKSKTNTQKETDNTKITFDDSAQKRIDEEIRAIEEIARIRQEFADKNREDELVKSEVERERRLLEIENLVADEVFKREAIAEVNKYYDEQALEIAKQRAEEEAKIEKEKNDKIKEDEERLRDAKFAIANQTLNVLGGLAKEGSALAKGIAASQATINTFQGVTSALSATSVIPDPFGTILKFANAAAIGIAGFINVKKILSTKPVTTSASGGSGTGAPPAPSFNLVQGTGSNQIADSIQGGNQPIKAYVVSSDVSSSQEMDRNIESNATL